ncbi:MAG: hypothetical protein ACP5IL_10765 [Syntrophobacteraceae bacterium]
MLKLRVEASLNGVERWIEQHNYKGYDPSDGLTSFLRPLTFKNTFLERILQQIGRQSPVNLRPIIGIKPLESAQGRSYAAWGYLERYRRTAEPLYKTKALACLEWLDRNKSPNYESHSWGYLFDYASRGGRRAGYESTSVWTGLAGQVFLEVYELFGIERHFEVIKSISDWIKKLPREKTSSGACISYSAKGQGSIHNANMIGAAFLAGAAQYTKDGQALEVAREAMEYSCGRQRGDGAWYYAEKPDCRWVDNFHTGYNLDSLKRYARYSGDLSFQENLTKGIDYYRNTFIRDDGFPRYYCKRSYPLDIQCASQAIETLTFFCEELPDCLILARKVADWTIENMQDEDGHFYYRLYPLGLKAKVPLIHWGQTTMYRALACLLSKL